MTQHPIIVGARLRHLRNEARIDAHRLTFDQSHAMRVIVGERLERTHAELASLHAEREEQVASGELANFGPHSVAVGDRVKWRSGWQEVVQVELDAVTVEGWRSADRVFWDQLLGVWPAGAEEPVMLADGIDLPPVER